MNEKFVNQFGFCEMYEWSLYPGDDNRFGRFVQFDKNKPEFVRIAGNDETPIIGVSSINYAAVSDNPNYWHNKYMFNEFGDIYMMKERLAVGAKQYDQLNEFSFIKTFPYEQFIPIDNPEFDKSKKYDKRSVRREWSIVTIKGKAIITDDGKCKPGEYCKPIFSDDYETAGKAQPANKNEENSFYVIKRMSDTTIMIFI